MKTEQIEETVNIPEGVEVKTEGNFITVKGPKGESRRGFASPTVKFESKEKSVIFLALKSTKREKKMIFSFVAHLKNMIKGVQTPHRYKLKICSGHFPMNVDVSNGKVIIKNFLGEKIPRTLVIKQGVDVKIDGDIITVESPDIELAGQVAAGIEQLTRITNKDSRVFQDGLYIIKKPRDPED